ncbi:hypothetical protein OG884_18805 [Streptosporangium sp. NBC_01755]|uniref:hypothetical protein n=1 Tax=Streptosporangium sp. NBC_01755 TaxID=2975949 RepID=UPI002DD84D12|nr:hypothetical protein [Streptosporangium sp. NBC_01755]WSD03859.1 hypothetical protein OG884_18805 [Streptosporangium sp. NBC_01755]
MVSTAKGVAGGLATLNASGRIPASQKMLVTTATLDFASIAAGAVGTLTATVTGAATGDFAIASPPGNLTAGLVHSAFVSAANTVTIRIINGTAGAIDPASATWGIAVIPAA